MTDGSRLSTSIYIIGGLQISTVHWEILDKYIVSGKIRIKMWRFWKKQGRGRGREGVTYGERETRRNRELRRNKARRNFDDLVIIILACVDNGIGTFGRQKPPLSVRMRGDRLSSLLQPCGAATNGVQNSPKSF